MIDITELSLSDKIEIAEYIKEDTLQYVNSNLKVVHPKETFYTQYGKRTLDFIIGLAGFIISSPINGVLAVVTYFDVGKPIIFKQSRTGLNQEKFTIYKFRNMTNAKDSNGELLPPKDRVTKWGKFVRKTSLDELLNFVSIIKGDMSVIGPRPLMDYYAERLNDRHKAIYMIKPGLECPTVKKVDHALSWQERLDNYIWYVENCSLKTDIKLCFRIVEIALDRKSTKIRANASSGGIMGYDFDGNIIYTKAVPEKYIDLFCANNGFRNIEDAIQARKMQ